MAIHTFAAIYIGSYEVSLKIFELSAKKKIRDIDYVRSRIELGADAYSKGSIGYELVEALCDTLREFAQIMKEYRVDAYEAYASAVLRDVDNELFILDQIRLRTGLTVRVLSNSEHRFISYKSVAMREEFEHFIGRSAAVVDVSGSGLQITVFSKGKVLTTQHLGLGTMRMREQLAKKSRNLAQYDLQIEELVVKEMADLLSLELVEKDLVTDGLTLHVGYSNRLGEKPAHGTVSLETATSSGTRLVAAAEALYERIVDQRLPVRRMTLTCCRVRDEAYRQYDLFSDPMEEERERRLQKAVLDIKDKYGKNAVLKGMNLQKGATTRERNLQIGGHKSGES